MSCFQPSQIMEATTATIAAYQQISSSLAATQSVEMMTHSLRTVTDSPEDISTDARVINKGVMN